MVILITIKTTLDPFLLLLLHSLMVYGQVFRLMGKLNMLAHSSLVRLLSPQIFLFMHLNKSNIR
ncbi:ORF1006 [White spot syndrome virus]|uniref:ORF1006 n=1 Tax=White spot syndrome virus TaxID=342409 RepID=A0A2D3I712_9VIRU|nr:ORF1006 [White spot syndrome virus]